MEFLSEYWHVITFYLGLSILIYLNRHRFEFEAKFIGLLRTNTGLSWMNKTGHKHSKLIKKIGIVGVFVGFLGMLLILYFLGQGLYQLIADPSAPPVVSPVLPGITIPGTGITVPLFEGLLALFIVVVVHEAAHGLVAAAHGLKVNSSGVGFLGPIPLAFVEPDEEQLKNAPHNAQLSVFAAGPWSNILQAGVFFALLIGFGLLISPLVSTQGVSFSQVQENSPAALAGIQENTTYTFINNNSLADAYALTNTIDTTAPGEAVVFEDASGSMHEVTLGTYNNTQEACVGVVGITQVLGDDDFRNQTPILAWLISFIQTTLYWVVVLAIGLGLANLMPLGPVDGGRMLLIPLTKYFGEEKGTAIWSKVSVVMLAILLILVFVPLLKPLFVSAPQQAVQIASCLPL